MQFKSLDVEVRRARRDDAQAIGAVFDAAVRAGWTYLGELVEKPMFAPHDWDQLVADHAPPNVLLVATDRTGRVLGYTAAHPEDGEMFLLFVHPCTGYLGHPFKNMDFETENDLPPLLANTGRSVYNQTSSYSILMLERRYSHMMEKLLLWVVFSPLSSG